MRSSLRVPLEFHLPRLGGNEVHLSLHKPGLQSRDCVCAGDASVGVGVQPSGCLRVQGSTVFALRSGEISAMGPSLSSGCLALVAPKQASRESRLKPVLQLSLPRRTASCRVPRGRLPADLWPTGLRGTIPEIASGRTRFPAADRASDADRGFRLPDTPDRGRVAGPAAGTRGRR